MENQKQTIDDLMNAMFDYMRDIHRCEGTIYRYRRRWQKVKDFMLDNKIKYYDTNVELAYLTSVLGDFDYHQLNRKDKELVNVINDSLGRLYSGKKSLFQEKTGLTGLFNSDKIPENKKIKRIYNSKNKAAHICIGNLGCKRNSDDKYPLFVLTNILGGSMSSRLFQKIREEKGLAYSIYSSNAQYLDTGVIIIYAASSPANAPRIIEMIKSEISSINKNGINETELDRARENIKGNIVLSVEDISSRMFRLGKGLLFDKKVLTIDAILKKIDKVGMDDIDLVAKKYLKPDNLNIIITGKSVRGRL